MVKTGSILSTLGLILAFSASNAVAGMCESVFDQGTIPSRKASELTQFELFFRQNLVGSNPAEELHFDWTMPYPVSTKRNLNGSFEAIWDGTHYRNYVGSKDPKRPLVGHSNRLEMSSWQPEFFNTSVDRNYNATIDPDLMDVLHAAQAGLERRRISAATLSLARLGTAGLKQAVGTIRMYDASEKPWGAGLVKEAVALDKGGTQLPFQRLNTVRGLPKLKIESYLDQAKREGKKVIEISKLSIDSETSPSIARRARNLIEAFWMYQVARLYPDAIFIGHVITNKHARHYGSRYSMMVAEHFEVAGNPEGESILWVEGWRLAQGLASKLKLEVSIAAPSPEGRLVLRDSKALQVEVEKKILHEQKPESTQRRCYTFYNGSGPSSFGVVRFKAPAFGFCYGPEPDISGGEKHYIRIYNYEGDSLVARVTERVQASPLGRTILEFEHGIANSIDVDLMGVKLELEHRLTDETPIDGDYQKIWIEGEDFAASKNFDLETRHLNDR